MARLARNGSCRERQDNAQPSCSGPSHAPYPARSSSVVNTDLNTTAVGYRMQLRSGLLLYDVCSIGLSEHPTEVVQIGESSNGCSAFKLRVGGRWLKCYECASPDRAAMVQIATAALERAGVPIPRVRAVVGHVVLADWVPGKP